MSLRGPAPTQRALSQVFCSARTPLWSRGFRGKVVFLCGIQRGWYYGPLLPCLIFPTRDTAGIKMMEGYKVVTVGGGKETGGEEGGGEETSFGSCARRLVLVFKEAE